MAQDFAYVFADKKHKTSVTVRPSAISLEITSYKSFSAFFERLEKVVEAAKDFIDSETFTRIGLRYINSLPFDSDELSGWVNPVLIEPLRQNIFVGLSEYSGRISSNFDGEGFLLQHGVSRKGEGILDYLIDFDLWREDVQVNDMSNTVQYLHSTGVKLFHWSLAEKTIAQLEGK